MAPNTTNWHFHHLSTCFGNGHFTSPKFHYGVNPTVPRYHLGNHITSYVLWLGKHNSFRCHNPAHPRLANPNWEREGPAWNVPPPLKPLPNPSVTAWVQPNRSRRGTHRLARRNLLHRKANAPNAVELGRLREREAVEMRHRRRSFTEMGPRMELLAKMWQDSPAPAQPPLSLSPAPVNKSLLLGGTVITRRNQSDQGKKDGGGLVRLV